MAHVLAAALALEGIVWAYLRVILRVSVGNKEAFGRWKLVETTLTGEFPYVVFYLVTMIRLIPF